MEFTQIDFSDIVIKEEPFHINKEVSFYSMKYDNGPFKVSSSQMKSSFGVKTNTFNNQEINFIPDSQFKKFILRLEDLVQRNSEGIFTSETKEFKSCLRQYKEYDEYIKLNVDDKFTKYDKSIDYKNKDCKIIFTITGIYVNNKNYGLSFRLNKISLD